MGLLMRSAIGHYTEEIQAGERVVREGQDPDGVHDMRVATRGLRAALDVFAEVGLLKPRAARMARRRLRRLARALGRVRDLDVMSQSGSDYATAHAGASEALADWMQRLALRHREERARLLRILDGKEYVLLMRQLRRLAKHRQTDTDGEPLLPRYCGGSAIWRRYEAVLACDGRGSDVADGVTPETLHELRIACKRLRYVVDLFAEAIGPESHAVRETLVRSQKVLGAAHDISTRLAALRRYSRRHAAAAPLREYIAAETKRLETLQVEAVAIRSELEGEPFRWAVAGAIVAL